MSYPSNTDCLLCAAKDKTIDKYIHLTTLLKKKINKYEGVSIKRHNEFNSSAKSSIGTSLNLIVLSDKLVSRRLRKGW